MNRQSNLFKLLVAVILTMCALNPATPFTGPSTSVQAASPDPAVASSDDPPADNFDETMLLTDPTTIAALDISEYGITDGLIYLIETCYGSDEFRWPGHLSRMPSRGGPIRTLETTDVADCFTFQQSGMDSEGIYYFDKEASANDGDPFEIEFRPTDDPENPTVLNTDVPVINFSVTNLRVDEDYLYWITEDARILRLSKSGGQPQRMAYTSTHPHDLVLSPNRIYWIDDLGLQFIEKSCSPFPCTEKTTAVADITGYYLRYYPMYAGTSYVGYYIFFVDTTLAQQRIRAYLTTFLGTATETYYTAPAGNAWQVGRPAIGECVDGSLCLFWREYYSSASRTGRVRRLPLNGGTVEDIATNLLLSNLQVETDDQGVYFMSDPVALHTYLVRLPFTATAITRDLDFDTWEVTQGIQSLSNDVALIAGKTTYVRVFARQLDGPPANDVEVTLEGSRLGTPLAGSPLHSLYPNRALSVGSTYNRDLPDQGWIFQLPTSWLTGTITLRARVDPNGTYVDSNLSNNNSGNVTFTFANRAPSCLIFMPVRTHTPYATHESPHFWNMIDLYKRLWPVPDVWVYQQSDDIAEPEVCWAWIFPYPCSGPYELDEGASWDDWVEDEGEALFYIGGRAFFSDDPDECDDAGSSVHYIGLIHPNAPSNWGGLAYSDSILPPASWVKMSDFNQPSSTHWNWPHDGTTLAHETMHNLERMHVDCGNPDDPDGSYPYPPCQIDNATAPDHYGFDVNTLTPIPYTSAADIMSYGSSRWTSDYTWGAVVGAIGGEASPAVQGELSSPSLFSAGDAVLLSGSINPDLATARLDPAWVMPESALSPALQNRWQALQGQSYLPGMLGAAPYHIRLLASDQSVLADFNVTTMETESHTGESHGLNFRSTFTAPAGNVARLVLLEGETELASLQPGLSNPSLTILSPAGGETFDTSMNLSWQASDPDPDDHLYYLVQYSPDNGTTWQAITTFFTGPEGQDTVTLPLTELGSLPGSGGANALIRVAATDGYHTTLSTSLPFTLADRPPEPFIYSPLPDVTYPAGQVVLLRGGAMDPEDGSIPDNHLVWSLAGSSYTGAESMAAGLAPGSYSLSLTATDSAAHTGTASGSLQVGHLEIPQGDTPTLDGGCDDPAYQGGVTLMLEPYGDGNQVGVHLLRTTDHLWACFKNLKQSTGPVTGFTGVRVDVDNNRSSLAESSDYGFFVAEDGTPFTYAGNGVGGMSSSGPGGLLAQVSASGELWTAELQIEAGVIGGWNHLAGIGLGHYWVAYQGNDYHWPYALIWNAPNTWAETALGNLPDAASLLPASAMVGGLAFTLAVEGNSFANGDTVLWNGSPRPTTFTSATHLEAAISSADLPAAGGAIVTVQSAASPSLVSAPLYFTIENPQPSITSISPATSRPGPGEMTLTVNGANFMTGAQVLWNGEPLTTTLVNSTLLQAVVPAGGTAVERTVGVTVMNPGPGGGDSNTAWLLITSNIRVFLPLTQR